MRLLQQALRPSQRIPSKGKASRPRFELKTKTTHEPAKLKTRHFLFKQVGQAKVSSAKSNMNDGLSLSQKQTSAISKKNFNYCTTRQHNKE